MEGYYAACDAWDTEDTGTYTWGGGVWGMQIMPPCDAWDTEDTVTWTPLVGVRWTREGPYVICA